MIPQLPIPDFDNDCDMYDATDLITRYHMFCLLTLDNSPHCKPTLEKILDAINQVQN